MLLECQEPFSTFRAQIIFNYGRVKRVNYGYNFAVKSMSSSGALALLKRGLNVR